jgi:peptidyl-tRNA hydrolase, PTH2 family
MIFRVIFINSINFFVIMSYKQVILARTDLKLPKGKLAAQVAHASVVSVLRSDSKIVKAWESKGMPKIVLKVADEKELIKYFQMAKDEGLNVSLITDAGRTVIAPGTRTCVGIGPNEEEKIDSLVSELKLL